MATSPYNQTQDVYEESFTSLNTSDTDFEELNLDLSDDDLDKMLIQSLQADWDHWNKKPWVLSETDVKNTDFLLGDQLDDKARVNNTDPIIDNRLFSSTRAILSYATGQLAKPDITPSKGDEVIIKGARDIGAALYQHALDEQVDFKVRAAVMNLVSRKRGYLKLHWDPNLGLNGDIVTEVVNPEDVIISRDARYLQNPSRVFFRCRDTVANLCAKYPEKELEIKDAFSVRRGVYSQTSKIVTYFECWFTYLKVPEMQPKEGMSTFIQEKKIILDKMPNPNWVYLKSRKKEMEANITSIPPKPLVTFNYINTGHSYIDETCLIEQAMPLQMALNKRLRQISENADYVNGRWVADKDAFGEEDARNLINKGARTIAMVDMKKNPDPLKNVAPNALGSWVENTVYDYRNEIDGMMGTPSQFKGAQPDSKDTLGRDMMIKQQAGALQDDLVRSIAMAMEKYYTILLQMMRVYYTDDYWFQTKGGDGKYEFILINGDKLDSNVKVSVQTDSTLPLDKMSIRSTALSLWQAGQSIDYKTLMEDLGLPNPDVRAERYLKSRIDPINFLKSVEIGQINAEAESDIQLIIAKKAPEERDNYDENYFNYFNKVMASNRFQKLLGTDPQAAQRLTMFLTAIQHAMMQSLNISESLIDQAGIINDPMPMPIPKTTVKIQGAVDPAQSAQLAGVQPDQAAPGVPPGGQQAAPPSSPPVPTQ